MINPTVRSAGRMCFYFATGQILVKLEGMNASRNFQLPNHNLPLDSAERLAQLPSERRVKGIVLRSLAESVDKLSGKKLFPGEDISIFADYELKKLIEAIPQAAEMAFPGEPPRRGIHNLGSFAFHAIYNSMAGRVIFALGGRTFEGALALVSKLYSMVGNIDVKLVDLKDRCGVVALRDTWAYPECYHAGIFQEALRQYNCTGEIKVAVHSMCDVDLEISWAEQG